jgi:hypothetical protein
MMSRHGLAMVLERIFPDRTRQGGQRETNRGHVGDIWVS